MIIVDCRGGLANRMQSIDSAFALAQALNRVLYIPWVRNCYLGARFDDLFDPIETGKILHCENDQEVDAFIKRQNPSYVIDHNTGRFPQIPNPEMYLEFEDIEILKRFPRIVIHSWARFYLNAKPFAIFCPTRRLSDRIDKITSQFKQTIGVHIRRTDHRDSISYSPTDQFKNIMRQLIDSGQADSFYLATDDPLEEKQLGEFPIVKFQKKTLNRSESEAIEEALVDLYCLSATKSIIGSAGSTFSFVASQIKGAPLTIAYRQGGLPEHWAGRVYSAAHQPADRA